MGKVKQRHIPIFVYIYKIHINTSEAKRSCFIIKQQRVFNIKYRIDIQTYTDIQTYRHTDIQTYRHTYNPTYNLPTAEIILVVVVVVVVVAVVEVVVVVVAVVVVVVIDLEATQSPMMTMTMTMITTRVLHAWSRASYSTTAMCGSRGTWFGVRTMYCA